MLLVDSMGILYRGHFAMSRRPLTSPDGVVTSGLNHLLTELLRLMEKYDPAYCAAVFDGETPGFRKELYPEYKANRPPMPRELAVQADLARQIIPGLGIPLMQYDGLEADDIIAGLAGEARSLGMSVVVLSSDKDLLQLVSDTVSVFRPGRPGSPGRLVTPAEVPEEIGTTADRVPLLLALAGDSSDNVPGARGIGEKTALRLLKDHSTLEDLYASLESLPPRVAGKLEESREMVELSLRLVTLNQPLPPELKLRDAVRGEPRGDAL
ncbi:MAG TPA: 5'-3' exonuclease H3TH domain-containing protein, partial [Synergistaceae bacterium]|nr:5'-3' exonuclease H3TH domain-containing protein [Synergistaceae bacterium]